MDISALLSIEKPWVFKLIQNDKIIITELRKVITDKNLFVLNGMNMMTRDGFYDECIKVFKLPDYFGRNLNALYECINDLEWLNFDLIIIVVANCDFVLLNENDDGCEILIDIFESAGEEWSKPIELGEEWDRGPVPFHAILQTEETDLQAIDNLPELAI